MQLEEAQLAWHKNPWCGKRCAIFLRAAKMKFILIAKCADLDSLLWLASHRCSARAATRALRWGCRSAQCTKSTKVDWVLAPHLPLHEENGLARMRLEMADDGRRF